MKEIIRLLELHTWYEDSDEYIEIAKGKYELPLTFKERWSKWYRFIRVCIEKIRYKKWLI